MWPEYRLSLQQVQLPVVLANLSVPSNGSVFALHLSRVAVRLYAVLARLLYDSTVYERDTPLSFTQRSQQVLEDLLQCVVGDAVPSFPAELKPVRVQYALLEQVLALQMAFVAFRRQFAVRRIWNMDFRYITLPNHSADQLFFLYYAIDNCEMSDRLYQVREFEAYRRPPAQHRVNMALRHFPRFANTFACKANSDMVAQTPCRVLKP